MIPIQAAFCYFSDGVTGTVHIGRCTKSFKRSNSAIRLLDVEQQLRARLILKRRNYYYRVHNVFYVIERDEVGHKYGRRILPSMIVTSMSWKERQNFYITTS